MKRILKKSAILLFFPIMAFAQTTDSFTFKLKGFVKTDVFYDSRQTVSIREGHLLLYPENKLLDGNGNDINANGSFNILSVQTRLTCDITGPTALGAKTSGLIEGAFFGNANSDINGFRLRHAYLKLNWTKSELLIGQYWNPMFAPEAFPGVLSFNTGIPFQPFARNPQIRFTQSFDDVYLSIVAASQRDFSSSGPNGGSSEYLRNAVLPILDFQLKYVTKEFVLGGGVDFKTLKPALANTKGNETDSKISSTSFVLYSKYVSSIGSIKLGSVYGENLTDLLMPGGYAVTSVDQNNGDVTYTALRLFSVWTDLSCGKDVAFGLFLGYLKNLGTDDVITGSYFARNPNIDKLYRISPRIEYNIDRLKFGVEIEHTVAAYGTPDKNGKVTSADNVSNTRILFAAFLFF